MRIAPTVLLSTPCTLVALDSNAPSTKVKEGSSLGRPTCNNELHLPDSYSLLTSPLSPLSVLASSEQVSITHGTRQGKHYAVAKPPGRGVKPLDHTAAAPACRAWRHACATTQLTASARCHSSGLSLATAHPQAFGRPYQITSGLISGLICSSPQQVWKAHYWEPRPQARGTIEQPTRYPIKEAALPGTRGAPIAPARHNTSMVSKTTWPEYNRAAGPQHRRTQHANRMAIECDEAAHQMCN
jgi:hypothetical protein